MQEVFTAGTLHLFTCQITIILITEITEKQKCFHTLAICVWSNKWSEKMATFTVSPLSADWAKNCQHYRNFMSTLATSLWKIAPLDAVKLNFLLCLNWSGSVFKAMFRQGAVSHHDEMRGERSVTLIDIWLHWNWTSKRM